MLETLFTCGITLKQQWSVLLWVILLYFKLSSLPVCVFFFLLWCVCSLEGVPGPLVRQKCRVEQNLHSTFMVCVGRPICTCLEQIRPAAAHGRPIPCWLFMIKICFGKPRSLDPEIRSPLLLALTPLPIYNQRFPFSGTKRERHKETERQNRGVGVNERGGERKREGGGAEKKREGPPMQMFSTCRRKTSCSKMSIRGEGREKAAPVVGWWSGHGWHQPS